MACGRYFSAWSGRWRQSDVRCSGLVGLLAVHGGVTGVARRTTWSGAALVPDGPVTLRQWESTPWRFHQRHHPVDTSADVDAEDAIGRGKVGLPPPRYLVSVLFSVTEGQMLVCLSQRSGGRRQRIPQQSRGAQPTCGVCRRYIPDLLRSPRGLLDPPELDGSPRRWTQLLTAAWMCGQCP